MKFELLNAALCSWAYDDKEVDKICTRLKGTVYKKKISIVSKLDIDIMTCNGMRYFTTFRYTAPVSFDLSMGGVWVTDLGGLPDSIFEKYPTLARRDDIRICLNDAKVVKHQNLIGNIKHHKHSNIGKK